MLKLFILPILLNFHPVHVTLTTITQAQDSDSLKVFFRMYYDDFLRDYKLYDPSCNLEILSAAQSFPADLISKYFNDKVQIHLNNKLLTGKVLNLSIQDNEIFMNLLYPSDKNPQRIKIRNQVLIGLYSDQTNMIFIKINKNEEAMRLTCKHFKGILSINR
jgi:ribosomal protein S24E